jgi:hypothetical protein
MTVHKMSVNAEKVKDALELWAESVKNYNGQERQLGYGRCVGFASGGTSSWEDFAAKVDKNMAVNVQAIYDGLEHPQQLAVDYFHLSATIKPQRYKIEDCYADALVVIEIALRRRGLI